MEISELTQGFRFYDVTVSGVIHYVFIMQMTPNGLFFLVLKSPVDEPVKMYRNELQKILDKKLFSMKDAKLEQLRLLEILTESLKSELKRETDGK